MLTEDEKKGIGRRIKAKREQSMLSQESVAQRLGGMRRTNIANYESGRVMPPGNIIIELAEMFNASADYLLGLSIDALVENRLAELGMTMEQLSAKTKIPLRNLQNIDRALPYPGDYEADGIIDRLARALEMDRQKLASAYARQEPPAYDGPRVRRTVEADFADGDSEVPPALGASKSKDTQGLSPKEERDIAVELERIMSSLDSENALAFDGEPLTDEDKELLRASLENSLRYARQVAKAKFTPKKYRKE